MREKSKVGCVFVAVLKFYHGCQGLSETGYKWFERLGSKNIRNCMENNFGFALISNFAGIFNEKVQEI